MIVIIFAFFLFILISLFIYLNKEGFIPDELDNNTYYNEDDTIIPHKTEERDEQQMAYDYIEPNDIVLELGGRYGTVSNVINYKLNNKKNHVVVEPDSIVIPALTKNRQHYEYYIENSYISNTNKQIVGDGYGKMMVDSESNKISNKITYDEFKKKYPMKFNVIVADCEGCLGGFLDIMGDDLKYVNKILFEADQPNMCNYDELIKKLISIGFVEKEKIFNEVNRYVFIRSNKIESFSNKSYKYKYKYTAIIIEPREHLALEYVLQNFNDNLSSEWQFIIFHGNKNKEYTEKISNKIFKSNRVKLINLNIDNLTINDYNKLFYTESFYDNILTETFLVFQTDSIICGKYKNLINDFIKYDYVGAPWLFNKSVGNGGLSLRKKSKMLEILQKCKEKINKNDIFENEDIIFSNGCNDIDIYKPSYDKAKDFSIETVYNNKSFGIHKAYQYIDIDKFNWCPEINKLKELNNV